MTETDRLASQLRKTAAHLDQAERAALELLIWHGYWLNRRDFRDMAVAVLADGTVVRWGNACEFLDAEPTGSTTERAVLDLCIDLAQDRYKFASMGRAHRHVVCAALAAALGQGEIEAIDA